MPKTAERLALIERVGALRAAGLGVREVGEQLGVSKNTVVGIIARNLPHLKDGSRNGAWTEPVRTMEDRLAALHARLDAALVRRPEHYQRQEAADD